MREIHMRPLIEELVSHKEIPPFTVLPRARVIDVEIKIKEEETILVDAWMKVCAREFGLKDPQLLKTDGNLRLYRFC